MPKRKARRSLFSVLTLRLKTNWMKGCVLRGKGCLFQEVRIPKNVDIFVYEMMYRGMRHEEVQKLHVDDLYVFRLMQQGIPVKEIPKRHAVAPVVYRLMQQGILLEEIPNATQMFRPYSG